MTHCQQVMQLSNELDNLVDRMRSEYDLSYAAVTGVLQMKIHLLCEEAADLADIADEGAPDAPDTPDDGGAK